MACLLLQNYKTMKYSDWKLLTYDEKRQVKFKHRPHVRIASLFTALFLLLLLAFIFRILKNRTLHVVRKPTAEEAFFIAKALVKDRLKMPATADFASKKQVTADTAHNRYDIASEVKTQDVSGKLVQLNWHAVLSYTGGDWADKSSWTVNTMAINSAGK
jgi:hypothetical protein